MCSPGEYIDFMMNTVQYISEELKREFEGDNTTHTHKFINTIIVREGFSIFAHLRFLKGENVLFSIINFGKGIQYDLFDREKKNQKRVKEIEEKIKKILHNNNISFVDIYYKSSGQI